MLRAMNRTFLALVSLVVAALAVACNGGEEPPRATTPEPSLGGTAAALRTITPIPAVTQAPLSPAQPVPLEDGASVTEVGVYLVEVATGRLWHLEGSAAWSPDGKRLARWNCCGEQGGLDIIDVPGGPAVRIFSGDIAVAALSPDGARIAFSRYADGPKGLYIVNRDGSGLKQLAENGTWGLQWSPSGDRIAFLDSPDHIYVLEVASGQSVDLADVGGYAPTWSPDGVTLAFSNDSGLYIYDPDTGDSRQVAAGPSSGPILWSPDGSRIAFRFGPRVALTRGIDAGNPNAGFRIFHVVEVDGSGEPKPLPPARSFSWSPDGTRVAYLSEGCITSEWDIYTVDPDGSSAVRLTNKPEAFKEGPFWSPTGASIAFRTDDDLILVDPGSGEFRTLASGGPRSGGPGLHLHDSPWSPDGRYIMFSAGGAHGVCD